MVGGGDQEFGGLLVSTADWPIVVMELPESRLADSVVKAALDHLEATMTAVASREEKLFVVTDLTLVREIALPSQRKLTAEWMKRTCALAKAVSVGGAHVTPGALMRGVITALYWLEPPALPTVLVATRREALLLGVKKLEEAGVKIPSRLRSLRGGNRA
jgi:hypothetical protein